MAMEVVLVTGCSSGLGCELCTALAKERTRDESRFKVYASARRLVFDTFMCIPLLRSRVCD